MPSWAGRVHALSVGLAEARRMFEEQLSDLLEAAATAGVLRGRVQPPVERSRASPRFSNGIPGAPSIM